MQKILHFVQDDRACGVLGFFYNLKGRGCGLLDCRVLTLVKRFCHCNQLCVVHDAHAKEHVQHIANQQVN